MPEFETTKLPTNPASQKLAELRQQRLAPANQTPNNQLALVPNHISFCIDGSSSMAAKFPEDGSYYCNPDETRLAAAKTAMRHHVVASDPKSTAFSLVLFNSYAETLVGKTTNYSTLIAANLMPAGSTNLEAGLEACLNLNPTRIILLSDGEPNGNCVPYAAVNLARAHSVKIDTIAIGGASDKILQEISELTGGTFQRCSNPEELVSRFVELESRNYLQIEHK